MSLRQDGTATVTRVGVALPHREAQPFQRRHRLIRRNVGAAEPGDAARSACVASRCQAGSAPAAVTVARLAAAQFQDHRGGRLDRIRHQRGIDAALEPLARVGDDLVPPAGQRDADRIEQRAFDEHGGGGFVAAGRLAADHAGDRLHAGGVADRAVLGDRAT